jgi:hypothetical protein
MNKNFILTELFLRKSRIMKSDIVSTVVWKKMNSPYVQN